ncbi:MAG: hypothetical protein JNJ47_08845, partial [Alphaproteobacteria bacterium]|nr:hypothetical protein [Alphaproteobacteria bacterium]
MVDTHALGVVRVCLAGIAPHRVWLVTWLCFLVPLLLYLPTLSYGFVYDDLPLVARNEAIRSL